MIGSINGWEVGILLVVVLLVVGPERLPAYAAQLGRIVREVRAIARGATDRVREELGDSFDDLKDLDPRQYDPRRIVREALLDDPRPAPGAAGAAGAVGAGAAAGAAAGGAASSTRKPPSRYVPPASSQRPATPSGPAPFDDEAT
ncbi:Sec-independent protein translocase TatB [Serinibacter arcticus]|uniref:Sec-independent protein translocase TatB n=1 Tax=Serinibacter arcticus TaxID=1655435 RepID=A0A2U1ZTP3_9MICO|nr:twin-arginine translocase TatA/TatE family subunit [Serinibacter arcticus]PWD50331.1 Sec-independent protein translocase TatB [Serinibacter arcticus]